jgi:hypothetical protein
MGQSKQSESRSTAEVAMKGREQRKVKEAVREEDVVSPAATGEQFFKVFFPQQSVEGLVSSSLLYLFHR